MAGVFRQLVEVRNQAFEEGHFLVVEGGSQAFEQDPFLVSHSRMAVDKAVVLLGYTLVA